MFAPSGLDAGLLVDTENVIPWSQRFSAPATLVEIKDNAGLAGKLRIAGEYPRAMAPGAQRVLTEPTPERGTCSDLQTSASGIANIGGACARSLQLGIRRQRKIIANGRKLIATGIANIRSVRRLIATGGLMMGRKTVIFLPRVRGVLERA